MDFSVIFKVVDLPILLSVVVIVEALKRTIGKTIPTKWWPFIVLLAGFAAALLKIDIERFKWQNYLSQAVVYAAAASLTYQIGKPVIKKVQRKRK